MFAVRWGVYLLLVAGGLVGMQMLRERRIIICRQAHRAGFWLIVASDIWMIVTGYLLWGTVQVVFDAAYFGIAINIPRNWYPSLRLMRRTWREHADHDEDCRYGPRRRRGRLGAKLRWHKVAINPVFAPV